MKQSILLISVLFLYGGLYNAAQAQNQRNIDSLMTLIEASKEDSNKVYYLQDLVREFAYTNPDTAIIIGNQARSLAERLKWKKGISSSLGYLGHCYRSKSDYAKALECHLSALKITEEIKDKKNIPVELGNIGIIYAIQGDHVKALEYYFKALKMSEEHGDQEGISTHFSNIGNIYLMTSDYPKALTYYFKALKIAEDQGFKHLQANNIGNIGITYVYQEDYPQALIYFKKGLKLNQEIGNKHDEATVLNNIGNVYGEQGNYPKQVEYQLQSLKIKEELGDKQGIAQALGNIGSAYTKTGKFQEAEVYLKRAIALSDSVGALDDLSRFEIGISNLYDTTGRYKLALEHYKNAMAIEDTLFNKERDEQITRKEMNYEFEKREAATQAEHDKQIAVADVEIKKQKLIKNFFIGGLALLLLLSYFIYNNFRTASKLKLQNIRNKIASDLHDDVGSTLNSISVYSEVAKQKSPAVVDELEHIGDASRKIIEVMSDIVWTINPKNDTFENIISRMGTLVYNLLKAKNIEHTFQADESLNETKIPLESRRNFYLIFKESLNNLVKYSQATRASITLKNENGFIKLVVRDNGIGFDVAETSKGNGLLNMKARAKEMKAQLKIESEKGNGTSVELILKA